MAVMSHSLTFRTPAQTSRDTLTQKPTWYLVAEDEKGKIGVGECSLIVGLSLESESVAFEALNRVAKSGCLDAMSVPANCPAVRFAVEMAAWDLHNGGRGLIANSTFAQGERAIDINGLVWMGPIEYMLAQLTIYRTGFTTLVKVGAHNWELNWTCCTSVSAVIRRFRRVDANCAFSDELGRRAALTLAPWTFSIEQPLPKIEMGLPLAWNISHCA